MSKRAYHSLNDQQRNTNTKILYFDLSTIQQCVGGSARCMVAENFLPQNNKSFFSYFLKRS